MRFNLVSSLLVSVMFGLLLSLVSGVPVPEKDHPAPSSVLLVHPLSTAETTQSANSLIQKALEGTKIQSLKLEVKSAKGIEKLNNELSTSKFTIPLLGLAIDVKDIPWHSLLHVWYIYQQIMHHGLKEDNALYVTVGKIIEPYVPPRNPKAAPTYDPQYWNGKGMLLQCREIPKLVLTQIKEKGLGGSSRRIGGGHSLH
ncbi:hypothetical protein C8Q75DRAFT_811889 [Abortiporus biennis]|nr:hypothetical protein C8Q75DRAFT_811889 [Abortiporus biennis]